MAQNVEVGAVRLGWILKYYKLQYTYCSEYCLFITLVFLLLQMSKHDLDISVSKSLPKRVIPTPPSPYGQWYAAVHPVIALRVHPRLNRIRISSFKWKFKWNPHALHTPVLWCFRSKNSHRELYRKIHTQPIEPYNTEWRTKSITLRPVYSVWRTANNNASVIYIDNSGSNFFVHDAMRKRDHYESAQCSVIYVDVTCTTQRITSLLLPQLPGCNGRTPSDFILIILQTRYFVSAQGLGGCISVSIGLCLPSSPYHWQELDWLSMV